jgi:hypothetical protein
MIKLNLLYYSLIIVIVLIISSCIRVKDFTSEDLKWFSTYNKLDTVVFISQKSELDTIIFFKKVAAADTVRDGRGFYNTNYLTVPYKLSPGSYHQFALMSDGTRFEQNIFSISKTSSGMTTLEITFLGMLFNGRELHNITQLNKYVYYFDSRKATYASVDEEKGKAINNFTFDLRYGIVKYTDERNVEWKRKVNSN